MMITLVIYIFILTIPLAILFVFSLFIISTALNKKNIKVDFFTFNFDFGKLHKTIKTHKYTSKIPTKKCAVTIKPIETESEVIPAGVDIVPEPHLLQFDENKTIYPEDIEDFENISEFDDLSLFTEPIHSKKHSLTDSIKEKFSKFYTNVETRAIEKEERRLQDDFEMFDPDEMPDEIPKEFRGKIKYFWHNHIGFRIGICIFVIFLVCTVIFYSFQMRNHQEDLQNIVLENKENADENKQELSIDCLVLNTFRQGLDEELSPIDVKADSMDEDPNLAEIIEIAQNNTGATTDTYPGSNTTTQPYGSIGTISIPSINLNNAPVMGSVNMDDLAKGTGHFENTPIFDGNVGIAGHNNTHFKYLVNVDIGDTIEYTVNGVTRTYQVSDVRAISDTDWGVFTDYGDNRLTLITCEHLVPQNRIAVTAIQVGADNGTNSSKATYTYQNSNNTNTGSYWQDSGDYHDAGSGYTDYIGVFSGNN